MRDYIVHKSQTIIDNQELIIRDLRVAHGYFKQHFPNRDSTWTYNYYNIFATTAPSSIFYELYKELNKVIRDYIGDDRPLWMQSWLNFHMPNEVLEWHDHAWPHHGYISIDPKKTKTVFKEYEIINEVGNIYLGPGNREHKVEILEDFDTPRITLGFDILAAQGRAHETAAKPFEQFSLVPIL
jgi:hypothetical protein